MRGLSTWPDQQAEGLGSLVPSAQAPGRVRLKGYCANRGAAASEGRASANQTLKPSGLNIEEMPAMSLPATVAKALLGVLLVLASLGGVVTALEWVAPPPGTRYGTLPPTPAVPIFPDADHPSPPCFAP